MVVDVDTLRATQPATRLELNDIGRVHLRTIAAAGLRRLCPQPPHGSFILIDEATNDTVGAG